MSENGNAGGILLGESQELLDKYTAALVDTEQVFRNGIFRQKVWGTVVAIFTTAATAFTAFQAQQEFPLTGKFAIAFLVAISGIVATLRDTWGVNDAVSRSKEKYVNLQNAAAKLSDGLDMTRRLREEEQPFHLRPIYVTARKDYERLTNFVLTSAIQEGGKGLPSTQQAAS